jgi:hypothetical protein
MWDGEYDGECELAADHPPPHNDSISTWLTDENGDVIHASVE